MNRRLALLAMFALALGGCAAVKPWEKEELSKPHMRFSTEGAHVGFFEHAVITNEQAEGGEGGAGGGCGCR